MSISARTMKKTRRFARRALARHPAWQERVKAWTPGYLERSRGDGFRLTSGPNFTLIESDAGGPRRQGVFLKGACDLPTVLTVGPFVGKQVDGTLAIVKGPGNASDSRADILLQTLVDVPPSVVAETAERLSLHPEYFTPTFFEPTFRVPGLPRAGTFDKDVVFLSLASNVVRTAYRHLEHGFLVDPGGWWLNQDVGSVLKKRENLDWFRSNFRSVGKLTPEQFEESFRTVIGELQARFSPLIYVYNVLTVEPGDRAHNYQLRRNPEGYRRRQFNEVLDQLADQLGFHVVDVDNVLKRHGINEMLDFSHFPSHLYEPIAAEVARMFSANGVVRAPA